MVRVFKLTSSVSLQAFPGSQRVLKILQYFKYCLDYCVLMVLVKMENTGIRIMVRFISPQSFC